MKKVQSRISVPGFVLLLVMIGGYSIFGGSIQTLNPAEISAQTQFDIAYGILTDDAVIDQHQEAFQSMIQACRSLGKLYLASSAIQQYASTHHDIQLLGHAYFYLAQAYLKSWDIPSAKANFQTALTLSNDPFVKGKCGWELARQNWYERKNEAAFSEFVEYAGSYTYQEELGMESDTVDFLYLPDLVGQIVRQENGEKTIQNQLSDIDRQIQQFPDKKMGLNLAKAVILTASGVLDNPQTILDMNATSTRHLAFNLFYQMRSGCLEDAKNAFIRYSLSGENPTAIVRNINAMVDSLDHFVPRERTLALCTWLADNSSFLNGSTDSEVVAYFNYNYAVLKMANGDAVGSNKRMMETYTAYKGTIGGDWCGTHYAGALHQEGKSDEARLICEEIEKRNDFSIPYLRAELLLPRLDCIKGATETAIHRIDNLLKTLPPQGVNFHVDDCRMSSESLLTRIKDTSLSELKGKSVTQSQASPSTSDKTDSGCGCGCGGNKGCGCGGTASSCSS